MAPWISKVSSCMSIHYTMRVDGDILFVCASGFDESLDEVQGYGLAIINASLEGGVSRVFCDETALEYRLGTFDTYQAAEFIAENVPALAKVALVCNAKFMSDASFFEDVVVNRGLTLRFFTDPEVAMRWLSEANASI
ncbi:conserved hypothetical protein [Pelodictyon phaeoclathratiforme BU-1]|uniref:STAS/SEC14 domain-containing protein n=2 Tax=Pelodictyon phaeoclathratiforme TaxID=34090 RepID=B4SAJ6_PELPB|nr:conserved hypothetical protein [Pelodictyon phaeoclathratiforme BU-1]